MYKIRFHSTKKEKERAGVQGTRGKTHAWSPACCLPTPLSAQAFGPSAASVAPSQVPRPCPGRWHAQALNLHSFHPPPAVPSPHLLCGWERGEDNGKVQLKERPPSPHYSNKGFGGMGKGCEGLTTQCSVYCVQDAMGHWGGDLSWLCFLLYWPQRNLLSSSDMSSHTHKPFPCVISTEWLLTEHRILHCWGGHPHVPW